MSKLYHIHEEDLQELERVIPEIFESLTHETNQPKHRVQLRRVKEILSDVRWNYQPHTDVEKI